MSRPAAPGEQCVGGVCQPAGGCTPACGADETCVSGVCQPNGTPSNLCDPCAGDADCGAEDDLCVILAGIDPFCGSMCESIADCPSGFSCQTVDSRGNRQCVPAGGSCEGCVIAGCSTAGQYCNPSSGECEATVGLCESCASDEQCGGASCVVYGGAPVCLGGCAGGAACAGGSSCQNIAGAEVCVPDSGSCGGGGCELTAGDCTSPTPILDTVSCRCLGCASADDCNEGQVCTAAGTCIFGGSPCTSSAECSPGFCQSGFCVDCLTPNDCTSGQVCNSGRCEVCSCPEGQTCLPPTYECVENSGACSSSADCPGGACDPTLGCFTPGACGAADPFGAPCPSGLACTAVLDIFGGSLGEEACVGCTAGDDSTCRAGETCTTPLIPLPGADQPYCSGGGGGGLPFP